LELELLINLESRLTPGEGQGRKVSYFLLFVLFLRDRKKLGGEYTSFPGVTVKNRVTRFDNGTNNDRSDTILLSVVMRRSESLSGQKVINSCNDVRHSFMKVLERIATPCVKPTFRLRYVTILLAAE
jgi:hypothetical protein